MNTLQHQKDNQITLIEDINIVFENDKKETILKIELEKPAKICQIRIPRGNNNVHCSKKKIENPTSETSPFLCVFGLVDQEKDKKKSFVKLMSETIRPEKSVQDIIVVVKNEYVCESLVIIGKHHDMRVLIYGEELNNFQKDQSNLNLDLNLFKDIEMSFLQNCENKEYSINLLKEFQLKNKNPSISDFRKLLVKGIITRNIEKVEEDNLNNFAFDQSNQVRTDQIRPWLIKEKSSEKKENDEDVNQEPIQKDEEDEEELNLKILMRLNGLEEYLNHPEMLRKDPNQLKIYLQTLEELCLIFENKSVAKECFQWDEENETKIFQENKLIEILKKVLKGEIDGVNEKSKAWRIFSMVVSQINNSYLQWEKIFEIVLSSEKEVLEKNYVMSLNFSLKFIDITNQLWWNDKMRNVILNVNKSKFCLKYSENENLGKRNDNEFEQKDLTNSTSIKLKFEDKDIKKNSELYYKILFSFCWNKLRECKSWLEYEQYRKLFIQVRISKLSDSLRKRTEQLSLMQSKHNVELKKEYEEELEIYLYDEINEILSNFSNIFVLIRQITKERNNDFFENSNNNEMTNSSNSSNNSNYLDNLIKKKKNIFLKSLRISKNIEEIQQSQQKKLPYWLGNLIHSEKLIETIIILLNLEQFVSNHFLFNKFIKQVLGFIKFLASLKGGVAFLVSKPELINLLIQSVKDLNNSQSAVYFPKIKELNYFLIKLKESVNLLNSLFKSFFAMFTPQDLIENLININRFIKNSLKYFCLVLKEPNVMDLFLMILKFDNNSSLFHSMNKEVFLCLDIFEKCFTNFENLFLNSKFNLVIESLNNLANKKSSQVLFSERNFNLIFSKINNIKNKLNPLNLIQKDLQKFVLFFKEKSRYTHNNIQTLLSNKNVRFDEERDFPKNDFQKKITRLKNDYLTFFGNNKWENAYLSISNLSMINLMINSNSSVMQKLVENDCFSPVISLMNISAFVLQNFLEPGEFSVRVKKVFYSSFQKILFLFLQISELCIKIIYQKTIFKLKNENFSKEYENIELFDSIINIIKIGQLLFPNFMNKLFYQELSSEIGWSENKLDLIRKNSFIEDLDPVSLDIMKYLSQQDSEFFRIFDCSATSFKCEKDQPSIYISKKNTNLFKSNLMCAVKQLKNWSFFSGSFDVVMTHLLNEFFEVSIHKSLCLKIISLLIRRCQVLDQKSKHRKVIETLFLDKVRVLKKSSLIVFLKHGSNFADSFLDMNVIKNNQSSVFSHFLYNFLPFADDEFIENLSIFILTLLLFREESFIESIHRQLENVLRDFIQMYKTNTQTSNNEILKFLKVLEKIIHDDCFKEFFLENEMFFEIIEFYVQICKNLNNSESHFSILKTINSILNVCLYPFEGFTFPNCRMPKKFNGDHVLRRNSKYILSLIKAINSLFCSKNEKTQKFIIENSMDQFLSILMKLSCFQTGRSLMIFSNSHYVLDNEKNIAFRRNSSLSSKELVNRYKGELFLKFQFKFGNHFSKILSNLSDLNENNISNINKLITIIANILLGDDNFLKGLSLIRVYFIEKLFFSGKSLNERLNSVKSSLEKYSNTFLQNVFLKKSISTINEILDFLSNYRNFSSKDSKIKTLFEKNKETQMNSYKGEMEKFKLRLQKYNIYYQKTIQGKISYDSDQMLEFLDNQINPNFVGDKLSESNILGHFRLKRYDQTKDSNLGLMQTFPKKKFLSLFLCSHQPVYYSLFFIKKDKIPLQKILKSPKDQLKLLNDFEIWMKNGVSFECENIFKDLKDLPNFLRISNWFLQIQEKGNKPQGIYLKLENYKHLNQKLYEKEEDEIFEKRESFKESENNFINNQNSFLKTDEFFISNMKKEPENPKIEEEEMENLKNDVEKTNEANKVSQLISLLSQKIKKK